MTKILKAIIFSAYSALLLHLVKSFFSHTEVNFEIHYVLRTPGTLRKLERDIKRNRNNLTITHSTYTKVERLPTDFKYILKWTEAFSHYTSKIFRNGQKAFLDSNCTYANCFLTNDKTLLVDIRNFDAILFDVENNWDIRPPVRAPHQKYVFTASESAAHYPVCGQEYEDFYNWTWTYKLDSDIRWSYITILDKYDNLVGPKINMTWISPMKVTPDYVNAKLRTKKRAVAWFVSNCYTKKRQMVARDLAKSLDKYNLKLDIYGWCGNRTCPRDRIEDCLDLLQKQYYFYLAFENSWAEDYVTEKILYPLLHYTVPVVYGGADYSRFLPPASYIDAGKLNSDELASRIASAIHNKTVYEEYFRWHNHYVYKEYPPTADICELCRRLQTERSHYTTVHNFRKWWNPQYKGLCKHESHFTEIKYY